MRYIFCIILILKTFTSFAQSEAKLYNGKKLTIEECLALSAEKEKDGDIREATRFLNMAADIYWGQQDYQQAIDYFEKSYKLNQSIGNENGMAMIAGNLGMLYNDLREYEIALKYFEQNLMVRKQIKEKNSVIASLVNISVALNNLSRHEEAIKRLEDALTLATEQSDVSQMRMCYGMLAETYLKADNTKKSKENYELYRIFHNLEMTRKGQKSDTAVANAELKARLAEVEKQNAELLLFKTENELGMKEQQIGQDNQTIENLTKNYTKQELANKVLKSENALKIKEKTVQLEKEKEKADNARFVRNLLIAGIIALLAFLMFVLINYNQKRKKNIQLSLQNSEINRQSNEISDQNLKIQERNQEIEQRNQEITNQYKEIAEARQTIEEQNELLKNYSQALEKQVAERTRQLMDANEELIYQNNQLEQYSYVTAHNLRGPLARMLGLAYIFNHDDITDEINQTILEKVQKEVLQLDEVIRDLNQILDVRKKAENSMESLDLEERIRFVSENFKDEIKNSGIIMTSELNKVKSVYFVKSYLDSILYNLVSNSIKYRHPDRQPVIHIKSEYFSTDFVCVSVSDNGLGIDLKQHGNKIFGLYKRFHLHREGKGLGLFLIKTQMESLGGKIKIQSQVNEGTTLKLFFKIHHQGMSSHSIAKNAEPQSYLDESVLKAI